MIEAAITRASCRVCRATAVGSVLDAGRHPVANRFPETRDEPEGLFPLVLGQCQACGLIQLLTPLPVEALVPRVSWITYTEPEGHLDRVVQTILELPGVGSHSVVGAVTFKDDSTLARLRDKGVSSTWRIDHVAALGVDANGGPESIQHRLTADRARALAATHPAADVLLVRHILEHAYDQAQFVQALTTLVRPGGYLLFEIPDCSQVLDELDYTTIWEEHLLYFTPDTYRATLGRLGLELVRFDTYRYSYENALVALTRTPGGTGGRVRVGLEPELRRWTRFATGLPARRAAVRQVLSQHRARGGKIAIFGAGHLACMFVNVMGVASEIAFVIDDHPGKRGRFMPGSRLPIVGSDMLLAEGVDLCLSSLSPESEEKVAARQTEFLARGGQFVSLFPSSPRALPLPE